MPIFKHVRRAIYEWGAIAAASTAVVCLVFWFVSAKTKSVDFTSRIGLYGKVSATNGVITICRFVESWDDVDWEKKITHDSAFQAEWEMPGLKYWYAGDRWIASVSLWFPAVVACLIAALFVRQYGRVRMELAALPQAIVASVESPCPLDVPDE